MQSRRGRWWWWWWRRWLRSGCGPWRWRWWWIVRCLYLQEHRHDQHRNGGQRSGWQRRQWRKRCGGWLCRNWLRWWSRLGRQRRRRSWCQWWQGRQLRRRCGRQRRSELRCVLADVAGGHQQRSGQRRRIWLGWQRRQSHPQRHTVPSTGWLRRTSCASEVRVVTDSRRTPRCFLHHFGTSHWALGT